MPVLSDRTIRRLIKRRELIYPRPQDWDIQPASVDLPLGYGLIIDDAERDLPFNLEPGQFALGTTMQAVNLPRNIVGRVEGKSSLGRRGLAVHITAGFIDPGFQGQITLELLNVSRHPIFLHVGMGICQISFTKTDRRVERPYGSPGLGSKYQYQRDATRGR